MLNISVQYSTEGVKTIFLVYPKQLKVLLVVIIMFACSFQFSILLVYPKHKLNIQLKVLLVAITMFAISGMIWLAVGDFALW